MALVQHHRKYKEIHGEDEIVMMDYAEHRKLHARLRKEGKCTIPAEELHKIAHAAYRRTEKGKAMLRKREKRRNRTRKRPNRPDTRFRRNRKEKRFSKNVDTNISLILKIRINTNNENVTVHSNFVGNAGRKLVYIDI